MGDRILEGTADYRKDRIVVLSGGVGGARMARGFAQVLEPEALTVVVNVGDDAEIYGVHVSPDVDTVTYTLAGVEGAQGWGRRDDTFVVMDALSRLGVDTSFRLGDRDLATCLRRTELLRSGLALSEITATLAAALGVDAGIVPATDDRVRTEVRTEQGTWLEFQEYFVLRGHRDRVVELRFVGADDALPAPGVLDAIASATAVVIAPSNPPLSIWPILAIPGLREALTATEPVVTVSPLIGGEALKGPAADVMRSLGLPPGNAGVAAAYEGLISHLVVDTSDEADVVTLGDTLEVVATDTRIADPDAAARLARELLDLLAVPDREAGTLGPP